jgi:hypothetical protein
VCTKQGTDQGLANLIQRGGIAQAKPKTANLSSDQRISLQASSNFFIFFMWSLGTKILTSTDKVS